MTKRFGDRISTAVVAVAAGLGGVAGSYAAVGLSREFVVSPVERAFTDTVPGPIIAFTIEQFGSLGQQLNLLLATLTTMLAIGAIAALGITVGRRAGTTAVSITVTGGATWAVAAVLTNAPIAAAGVGLGSAIVVGIAEAAGRDVEAIQMAPNRRRVIAGSLTALGLGTLGFGAGSLDGRGRVEREPVDAADNPGGQTDGDEAKSVAELRRLATDRSLDVASIEPLLSRKHYRVDINAIDPSVDREEWTLSVTGDVETELELSFDDLRELPAENRIETLRCVGDPLNGKKIDTAIWTGIPVSEILAEAAPTTDCDCVMLRAADGFYEEFPLSALEDGLLAYGMNGETLPRGHGYPLRALVPGHWGEVNVKWLTEIEVLEYAQKGYWEKKGWHGTGPVHTVAKLWNGDNHDGIIEHEDGTIELAGHAYAGTRGIERVEVSTDGGESWADAELTEPLPGDDVWRQWTYTYDSPGEKHEVVVRATDGNGDLQPRAEQGVYPRGATGWVSQTVKP